MLILMLANQAATCTQTYGWHISLHSSVAMHVFSIARRWFKMAVCAADEWGSGIRTKPKVELLPPHTA